MTEYSLALTALVNTIYSAVGRPPNRDRHDRGAVSIEQVLWYAAAAVSVAVVAAILWSQIKTTASTSVNSPSAP